jgi:putative holliday junction resolvase
VTSALAEGKVLALDYGERRIGIAVSDALGITAQAKGEIHRTQLSQDLAEIQSWVQKEEAVKVVIGLPINMDGTQGPNVKKVLAFKGKLEGVLDVPVDTWDERMSTLQAESVFLEADLSRAKRKKKIDRLAACIFLQAYLDFNRRTS